MTTMFLSSQNVLEDFSSSNSEAITELVKKELSASGLDISSGKWKGHWCHCKAKTEQ